MATTTHWQELYAHCEAMLQVFEHAHVPSRRLPDYPVTQTLVVICPALSAVRLSWAGWHCLAHLLRGRLLPVITVVTLAQRHVWLLPLVELLPLLHYSRHPVGLAYAAWQCRVEVALTQHGIYAPERHHSVLPGEELKALECREGMCETWRRIWPHEPFPWAGHGEEINTSILWSPRNRETPRDMDARQQHRRAHPMTTPCARKISIRRSGEDV
jgi:hypothetical protein